MEYFIFNLVFIRYSIPKLTDNRHNRSHKTKEALFYPRQTIFIAISPFFYNFVT